MKTCVSGAQQSSILGVWTAPGAPEATPKGGALRAPPFGVVYGAPGAVQTPKTNDFWVPEFFHDYITIILYEVGSNNLAALRSNIKFKNVSPPGAVG